MLYDHVVVQGPGTESELGEEKPGWEGAKWEAVADLMNPLAAGPSGLRYRRRRRRPSKR